MEVNQGATKKKLYWSLFPCSYEVIRGTGYKHVASGIYQLPLFEGAIPTEIINAVNPYAKLLELLAAPLTSGGVVMNETGSSIIIKTFNPLLENVLSMEFLGIQPNDPGYAEKINDTYVAYFHSIYSKARKFKSSNTTTQMYKYDMQRFLESKKVDNQFNKVSDIKQLLKSVNIKFSEVTNLVNDAI